MLCRHLAADPDERARTQFGVEALRERTRSLDERVQALRLLAELVHRTDQIVGVAGLDEQTRYPIHDDFGDRSLAAGVHRAARSVCLKDDPRVASPKWYVGSSTT